MKSFSVRFLTGNVLKILGAILMVIDHIGFVFFPKVMIWRYIGRLAMPIFAFMIAEGCRYTKDKLRYFLTIAGLGVVCQIVYFLFDKSATLYNILITFSLGIIVVFALDYLKRSLINKGVKVWVKILSIFLFLLSIAGVKIFCHFYNVDYGFWGCMLPAFASILDFRRVDCENIKAVDKLFLRVLTFAIGLVIYVLTSPKISFSIYSLLALPLLLLYGGKRGKWKLKYFFYIFYPLHLALIEGIFMLMI
jgi:hypothetical protein